MQGGAEAAGARAARFSWPLAALTAAALGLRLFRLDFRSIWLDEAYSLVLAASNWAGIIRGASMDIHPPLYYLLLAGWIRVFGTGEFAARALSAVLGAALVPAVWLLARRLANPRVAGWAAALAAFSPYLIEISRSARMASLLALTSILSLYFFWRLVQGENWRTGLAYLLATLGAVYTHYFAFLVVFSQNLFLFMGLKQLQLPRAVRQRWFQIQIVLLAGFAPWLSHFYFHLLKGGPSWRGVGAGWLEPARSLYHFFVGTCCWSPWDKILALGFLGLALLLVLWGLRSKIREAYSALAPRAWGLLLTMIFAPLGLVLVYSWNRLNVFDDRYLAFVGVMLLVILGVLLAQLPRRLAVAAGVLFLAAFAVPLRNQYFVYGYYDNWRAAGAYLNAEAAPGDKVAIYPAWDETPLQYYLRGRLAVQGIPGTYDPVSGNTRGYFTVDPKSLHHLQSLFIAEQRVWLVTVNPGPAQDLIRRWFASEYTLRQRRVFGGIRIESFSRTPFPAGKAAAAAEPQLDPGMHP